VEAVAADEEVAFGAGAVGEAGADAADGRDLDPDQALAEGEREAVRLGGPGAVPRSGRRAGG
jgi:hypothetical protein